MSCFTQFGAFSVRADTDDNSIQQGSLFAKRKDTVQTTPLTGESESLKATHWSTNGDITDAHISATIQQILTKFSAVVSYRYVKQRQIGKFQLIYTWVTMLSKYIILQYGGKSRSKNKNLFCLIYLCICW